MSSSLYIDIEDNYLIPQQKLFDRLNRFQQCVIRYHSVEAIKEGETYSIDADACIDCGACEATCPNEAITEA